MVKSQYARCVLLIGALCMYGWSQETITGLQNEIARVEREIQREKEIHKKEIEKQNEFEKRKKEKLAVLEAQKKSLIDSKSVLQTEIAKLNNQKASVQGQTANLKLKKEALTKQIISDADVLIKEWQTDFPSGRDQRLSMLQRIRDDLGSGSLSPEEGLQRMLTLFQGALELGWETESYTGTYRSVDGKIVDGRYIRLGAVLLAFASIDGKVTALLVPENNNFVWKEKELAMEQRQAIKHSVEIIEGKVAPELAILPLPMPTESVGEP